MRTNHRPKATWCVDNSANEPNASKSPAKDRNVGWLDTMQMPHVTKYCVQIRASRKARRQIDRILVPHLGKVKSAVFQEVCTHEHYAPKHKMHFLCREVPRAAFARHPSAARIVNNITIAVANPSPIQMQHFTDEPPVPPEDGPP